MTVPPFKPRTADANLVLRLASSLILGPLVLLAVWVGGHLFLALVLFSAVILMREWIGLCARNASPWVTTLAYLTVVGSALLAGLMEPAKSLYVAFIPLAVAAVGFLGNDKTSRWLAVGVAYLSLPLIALLWIRSDPQSGQNALIWLFAVVWGTDSGAYLFGRAIGGPKLAPRLSPNKTWAGLLGGMFIAVLIGWATAVLLETGNTPILASLGAVLACTAQAGDLFESWVKRSFDAKDSGTLIPGHGGLMDRVDGLLAAAIVAALVFLLSDRGVEGWL